MPQENSRNSKAVSVGFGLGAACVVGAAALLYLPNRPVASSITATDTVAAVASPAPQATGAPGGDLAPNPHSFPTDRNAPAGAALLSGTISLDPSISQSPGARVTVFLIARTGEGKGRAVLARRIVVESFPAKFSLSAADSMMAGERPAAVSLEARIDLDGDAMTREPGSPTARARSVTMGSSNVVLTLRPEA